MIGEYIYDKDGGRHQAFYSPKKDVIVRGIHIAKDERVEVEQSLKYSEGESETLWREAGLKEVGKWQATKEQYSECSKQLHLSKNIASYSLAQNSSFLALVPCKSYLLSSCVLMGYG